MIKICGCYPLPYHLPGCEEYQPHPPVAYRDVGRTTLAACPVQGWVAILGPGPTMTPELAREMAGQLLALAMMVEGEEA